MRRDPIERRLKDLFGWTPYESKTRRSRDGVSNQPRAQQASSSPRKTRQSDRSSKSVVKRPQPRIPSSKSSSPKPSSIEALVEGFLAQPAEEIALRLDFNDNLIAVTQLLRHHAVPSAVARHFKRALAIRRREQSPVTHTAESPKDIDPSSQEEAPGEYRVSTPIPTVDPDVIFNPESKSLPQSTEEAAPGTSTTVDVSCQTSPRRKRKPRNRGAKRPASQAIAAAARTIHFDSSRLTITFNNRQ